MIRLAMVWLLLLSAASARAEDRLTVVIDPGHGGSQMGAPGPTGKFWEKALTLQIAKRFAAKLRTELHANALLTRDTDEHLPLRPRIAFANAHGADLFVSIHLNSMPTPAERRRLTGIETFFLSADASGESAARVAATENAEDEPRRKGGNDDLSAILDDLTLTAAHQDASRLAKAVHRSLVERLHAVDHGVQQAPFVVLMGAQMPAILCEVGFVSHPAEGPRLATPEYQEQVADALLAGVRAFLAETRNRDVAVAPKVQAAPAQAQP